VPTSAREQRDPTRNRPWPLFWSAVASIAFVLSSCHASPRRLPVAAPAPDWVWALPETHEALSAVLAAFPAGEQPRAWSPGRADALRGYLARLARVGPTSRPELFPSNEAVLAYLVDAHVAWALAFGHSGRLTKLGVDGLREQPIAIDGRARSLRGLMEELAWRAPWEPRLALFLNAGWRGGPPLPPCAVEGRSLDWQLTLQAERCGRSSGFWTLDAPAKRLGVSAYTELMWGLPQSQPARARRLLDLVPPPERVREAVLAACGASLQRCVVVLTPFDTGRLFTAPEAAR